MENIDYSWEEKDLEVDNIEKITVEPKEKNLSSRSDLQIMRRLFHMGNGVALGSLYLISLSHEQMIHFLGTIACGIYIIEQVRINYPEKASKFLPMTRFIIRAEEQLKESAMVPYAIALLLTIITFPKTISMVGIYTLAIADPLSAIIGIKYGKNKIGKNRTLEGSGAFFIASFLSCFVMLAGFTSNPMDWKLFLGCFLLASSTTAFDMINLEIDDNITIPLFTCFAMWLICEVLNIALV